MLEPLLQYGGCALQAGQAKAGHSGKRLQESKRHLLQSAQDNPDSAKLAHLPGSSTNMESVSP